MLYRYQVAHKNDGAPAEPERPADVSGEVQYEYRAVSALFKYYFQDLVEVDAHYRVQPDGSGLEITLDSGIPEAEADSLVAGFLVNWNARVPGLAVALKKKFAPEPSLNLRWEADRSGLPR